MHSLRAGLAALVYTLWYGIPILVRSATGSKRLGPTCRSTPRRWATRLLRAARVEVEIEGAENLSSDGPHILVANHQSWIDVLALAAHLPVDYRFVAKKELERIPVFGPAWQACGHVSIDRGDLQSAIASLEKAGEMVRRERPTLIMFPEGTRSPTGEVRAFKKGAFVLAIQIGAPIVPAAILGTREIMPKGQWRIRPGRVRVRIGAPISVEGLGHGDRDTLSLTSHRAVLRLREGAPLEGPWEAVLPTPRTSGRLRRRRRSQAEDEAGDGGRK